MSSIEYEQVRSPEGGFVEVPKGTPLVQYGQDAVLGPLARTLGGINYYMVMIPKKK